MSDLDNLDHLAATADTGANEVDALARGPELDENGQPVVPAQPVNYGTEAAGVVDMFTAMLTGFAPKTSDIWTPAAKERTAMALAPVMEKYGFSFGAMPPELTLAIVAGPLLWQSSRIVAAQINADKKPQSLAVTDHERPRVEVPKENPPEQKNPMGPETVTHPQMGLYAAKYTAKAQP